MKRRRITSAVVVALVLGWIALWPGSASAQTGGPSPCCGKICTPSGSSIQCNTLNLAQGPGNALVRGCADVEAPLGLGDICYGGVIVTDTPAPTLVAGCLCLLSGGAAGGPCVTIPDGTQVDRSQCTGAAVAFCGDNVTVTENDPACGSCPANPCGDGVCSVAAGENCSTCAADCGCTGGSTCQNGVCQPPPPSCGDGTCDPNAGENCATCQADCGCTGGNTCQNGTCAPPPACSPEGGACDKKSDCCADLNCVDNGQTDQSKVCAPNNSGQPGG